MPSTGGRVKMPHNNRLSTSGALKSNDMWSKTIGHDPHASEVEGEASARQEQASAREAREKGLLELARLSNLGSGAERGANFAQQVFWGLKRKGQPPKGWEIPELPSSGDDESLPEINKRRRPDDEDSARKVKRTKKDSKKKKKDKKKKKKKKHHRKAKKKRSSSSSSSSSSEEEDDDVSRRGKDKISS